MAAMEEELIEKVEYTPETAARDSDILLLHTQFGKKDDTINSQVYHSVAPSLNGDHVDNSLSKEFDPPEVVDDTDNEDACDEQRKDGFKLKIWTGEIFEEQRGRNIFFDDGIRRIDYVLAYPSKYKDSSEQENQEKKRLVFERNLEEEGLELEHDIVDGREIQYTKVHAPWEVLVRYAEIMKTRMPIKEVPDEIRSQSMWEIMADYMSALLSPFQLDPAVVPPVPKKFTHVFERDKSYLFAIPERKEMFFSHAARSRITDYILRRKKYSDEESSTFSFGIKRLISMQTYSAAYPLHEGSWKPWTRPSMRRLLYENWAHWRNWFKVQPLDYIRVYYGEKTGLYFAWLGYYTYMLIPASILGLAVFIYGVVTIDDSVVAKESCDWSNNFTMCPLCNKRCPYWNYAAVCTDVYASHMFDNALTVAFSMFMGLWGTVFLEFWKREQAAIQFKWNLLNFQEEEEPPRPEYLIRLSTSKFKKKHKISGQMEPFLPFWRRRVPVFAASASVMLLMCLAAVGVVIGIIVYRMSTLSALYLQDEELLYKNAGIVASTTAACINLVAIFILNFAYSKLAEILTDWECLRTQSEYDSSLSFKLYVLQFVNYYSSIFYIAFFKGRFAGRPGNYNTFFGARQEECQGGCLMELCIQLAIIFVGKQLLQNNLMEIFLPRVKRWIKEKCCSGEDKVDKSRLRPWEKDLSLNEMGQQGLFYEYLEILIQFGFVTLFVAAFPLAPFCALLNNIIEIRADADKFVTQYRRPMAQRTKDIGIWYEVCYVVSRLAILTNAFLITSTSSFIERLVYEMEYSDSGGLEGFVNSSLAYFNVSDFDQIEVPDDPNGEYLNITLCRYKGYNEPPWANDPYAYTTQYWHIMAAQFIFVVVFENVIIVLTSLLAYMIPDMPRKLTEQVHREAYLTNEIILKTELEIAKGQQADLSPLAMRNIRRRVREAFGLDAKKPSTESLDKQIADSAV